MGSRPKAIRWFDRLSFPVEIGATVVGLAMVWHFTDISTSAIGGATIGIVGARLWQPVKRRFGINNGWGKIPIGLALFGLGIYSLTYSEGMVVIKIGFLLVGGWLVLDGLYDLKSGAGATVSGSPNPMERFGDAQIVGRAIEREPQSADELISTVDLSRHRIEGALEILVKTDAVSKRNDQYYAQFEDRSIGDALKKAPSRATNRVSTLPERILRPFRLFGL
ncbi:hypothetical protein [Natrialba sp. PRR66]|uniref:hypothetical protein n=1 Tax=Natrialba sp. PRR66 TaxID=3098146 RepID=UPI002B1D4E5C|nr:hypothetical protein [Natrialba sp. PRR66]